MRPMDRAIVLIGVQRTGGNLPPLPAVHDAIAELRDWAKKQKIPANRVAVVSDLKKAVNAEDVFEAVEKVTRSPTLQQLVIYFCGHGIANNRNEYWLLSAAPNNPNAAINVSKSAELASTGRIPHVVFLSDACRTAATTTIMESVTGSTIIPNTAPGPARAVDLFYSCLLGDPSWEVRDPVDASKYHAIYTEVLASGLKGKYPEALETAIDQGRTVRFVLPPLLKPTLIARMAERAKDLESTQAGTQRPDAKLSQGSTWLARITGRPIARRSASKQDVRVPRGLRSASRQGDSLPRSPRGEGSAFRQGGSFPHTPRGEGSAFPQSASLPRAPRGRSSALPSSGSITRISNAGQSALPSFSRKASALNRRYRDSKLTFRQFVDLSETGNIDLRVTKLTGAVKFINTPEVAANKAANRLVSNLIVSKLPPNGLVVHGAEILEAHAGFPIAIDDRIVQLRLPNKKVAATILVRLDCGCAVIPILRGRPAILTVEEGQLVDVWYSRAAKTRTDATQAMRMHARIAASSRYGLPPPTNRWPSYAEDPALAIYRAYALADVSQRPKILTVERALLAATGTSFFDIQLLTPGRTPKSSPGFPLLGRGWALLDGTATAEGIPRPFSSHWTLFPDSALEPLMTATRG